MHYLLLIFLLGFQLNSFAQQNDAVSNKQNSFPNYINHSNYRILLMNVGIGMPPNFVNGRLNPGFEIGLQHHFKGNALPQRWDYSVHLGYFSNRSLQRAIYVKPGIGYTLKPLSWLAIRPSLNNAFMLVRQINDEFEYIGNSHYEKVNSNRFQLCPSFSIETQVKLMTKGAFDYKFVLGYEFGVQLPFSELSGILPLNQLKLGLCLTKLK